MQAPMFLSAASHTVISLSDLLKLYFNTLCQDKLNKEDCNKFQSSIILLINNLENECKKNSKYLEGLEKDLIPFDSLSWQLAFKLKSCGFFDEAIALRSAILSLFIAIQDSLQDNHKNKNSFIYCIIDICISFAFHDFINIDIAMARNCLNLCYEYLSKLPFQHTKTRYKSYHALCAKVFAIENCYQKARKSLAIAASLDQECCDMKVYLPDLALIDAYVIVAASCSSKNHYARAIRYYRNANVLLKIRKELFTNPSDEVKAFIKQITPVNSKFNYELTVANESKKYEINKRLIAHLKSKLQEQNIAKLQEQVSALNLKAQITKLNNFEFKLEVSDASVELLLRDLLVLHKFEFSQPEQCFVLNSIDYSPKMFRKIWKELKSGLDKSQPRLTEGLNNDKANSENISPSINASQKDPQKIANIDNNVEEQKKYLAKKGIQALKAIIKNSKKNALAKSLAPKQKIVRWEKDYPEANLASKQKTYFPIYGRRYKKTFAFISSDVFREIPVGHIGNKLMKVVQDGKVVSAKKQRGSEGYVFYKDDHVLKKYGSDYTCKIKLLGSHGVSNMRLLGKKVTDGVVVSGDKETPCELYVFDQLVTKAHR